MAHVNVTLMLKQSMGLLAMITCDGACHEYAAYCDTGCIKQTAEHFQLLCHASQSISYKKRG